MKPEPSPIAPGSLPVETCPDHIWARIEQQLDSRPAPQPTRPSWNPWRWVAVGACIASVAALWFALRPSTPTWNVERNGSTARLAEGEWIETGSGEAAQIQVGEIGTVRVRPNSRIRILRAAPTEHRLDLAEGEIEAEINAPPRLFFVHTPSTTAIDLGCAYRMKTDAEGNGSLEVTGGWVEMERDGGTSLVPAGASCRIRAWQGGGTPYFNDAPSALITALDDFDQRKQGLDRILPIARARDTLTLWHLLQQTDDADRERVYDRMAELAPPPADVTRERVLALEEETLRRWREELAWVW